MDNTIRVEAYSPEKRELWDQFVERSNNGTMFHLHRFLDYHAPDRWNFHHLMFYEGDTLVGVLPAGRPTSTVLWSPTGASYGSIVTADTSFERCLNIVDALIEYCRQSGISDVYLIPPPLIYSENYEQHIEYGLLFRKAGFELHYISHAIELKHGKNFLGYFDATARKTVRKVLRNKRIRIEDSTDYKTFHHILLENKARHNVKPTHSLEELEKLALLMPDKLKLMMVYLDDEPIAGSLLFLTNRNVVLCFYNMLKYEHEHERPIYLVMYETCRWAQENGYRWVDIGVSQDTKAEDPMTPSLGLISFKERFNARGILRNTYHLTILPKE